MKERRSSVRLAGGGKIDAAVIDGNRQPVTALRHAEVVNVSAGGMAVATTTPIEPGAQVRISCPDETAVPTGSRAFADFEVRVLETTAWQDGKQMMRCRLTEGVVPASLIYRWSSSSRQNA